MKWLYNRDEYEKELIEEAIAKFINEFKDADMSKISKEMISNFVERFFDED